MLRRAIAKKGFSLTQICFQVAKRGIWLDRSVLSKLQNGKIPPARDDANKILAEVLGMDSDKFRVAAAKEIMPVELIELIKQA